MIENYLDFVKGKRALALHRGRRYMDQSRNTTDEWSQGFYRGMALTSEFESRRWRTLQKDIEAVNERGCYLVSYNPNTGIDERNLS